MATYFLFKLFVLKTISSVFQLSSEISYPHTLVIDCTPQGSSVHGILQARILEWLASHSLLQGIFPTQGSNPSLLPCRQILYQLSHHGSPLVKQFCFVTNSLCYLDQSLSFRSLFSSSGKYNRWFWVDDLYISLSCNN